MYPKWSLKVSGVSYEDELTVCKLFAIHILHKDMACLQKMGKVSTSYKCAPRVEKMHV